MMHRVRSLIQQRWWKTLLPLIFIGLFTAFVVQQRDVMRDTVFLTKGILPRYLIIGVILVVISIAIQGFQYQLSFRAIHKPIPFWAAIQLYLKRFFLGTFLPAGFTVSQYAYQKGLKQYDITDYDNHLAATIYLALASVSYAALLAPTIVYLFFTGRLTKGEYYAAAFVLLFILVFLISCVRIFRQKGTVYRLLCSLWPDIKDFLSSWQSKSLVRRELVIGLVTNMVLYGIGIALFIVTFAAMGLDEPLWMAIVSYAITILVLYISPVFQGIGLVEFSLVEILMQYGVANATAVGITVFYRVFQLWLPLLISGLLIAWQRFHKVVDNGESKG